MVLGGPRKGKGERTLELEADGVKVSNEHVTSATRRGLLGHSDARLDLGSDGDDDFGWRYYARYSSCCFYRYPSGRRRCPSSD